VAAACGAGMLATAGAAFGGTVPAVRPAVPAAGLWGRAVEVPGLAALNRGGFAEAGSVSCASAGSCAAGGIYVARHGNGQGFVVTERGGRWGRTIAVPGLAALAGKQNSAQVFSVSCPAPGTYTAVGGDSAEQVFVTAAGH
jgi:hypothetical protein